MPHQLMGYDRAITMFSPDGRLLQVEYAKKTVKQGSTAIAMVCSDGVLFFADRRIVDPLIIADSVEKIFKIDSHMGAVASGILSDARVLVERAQLKAQQNRVQYDEGVDTLAIVKDMCNLKQLCTQSGGLRPFGVALLVGGVDPDGVPRLFETDPTGIFFQYWATVIGENETEIDEVLLKEYNNKMTIEDGLRLCFRSLYKILDKNFNVERIDSAYIPVGGNFTRVTRDKLDKLLREFKKK